MTLLGVDFGGTKIEAAALGPDGRTAARHRVANPGGYEAAIAAVRELVEAVSTGQTSHRGTFARAVPEWKIWFDSL